MSPEEGTYPAWSLVTLTAETEPGFSFAGWVADGLNVLPRVVISRLPVVMFGDIMLKALFLPDAPILIQTVEDLQKIGQELFYPLSWDYLLDNDIDASTTAAWNNGMGFNPIGNAIFPFTGSFDGQGHTITGLFIRRTSESNIGLFGYVHYVSRISNLNLYGGSISGFWTVGGLVGYNRGALTRNFASSSIFGNNAGGLVGQNSTGTIMECYAAGAVSGARDNIGGLVGTNFGTVMQCHAMGMVSGYEDVGGLIGENYSGTVTRCYAMGKVSGTMYAGGLIGENFDVPITSCYATGAVEGISGIGGLIGINSGPVTQCYAVNAVSGSGVAGGLIGHNFNTVTQCFATGSVLGEDDVGGLIGYTTGRVIQCYSAGKVSGNASTGGLVGANENDLVTDDYWDIDTSGQTVSAGGAGKTTAEMIQQATFTDWDFSTVWAILENTTYPYLRNLPMIDRAGIHAADRNMDRLIDFSELLRVIQLFNSGGYHCDVTGEDGYAPGVGDTSCGAHDSDYAPQDWQIGLSELLRLIQFYNSGGYHGCAGSEDGYCPN